MSEIVTNKLWLRTYSSNEDFNGDLDIAHIEINTEDAVRYVGYCKKVGDLGVEFGDMGIELVTHNFTATWCCYHEDIDDVVNGVQDGTIAINMLGNDYETDPLVQQTTEMDRIHVTSRGIQWSCNPKYSEVTIETTIVPLRILEILASGAVLPESLEEA